MYDELGDFFDWMPVFEPDASSLGAVGDAIYKINEAFPGYMGEKAVRRITGIVGDNNEQR